MNRRLPKSKFLRLLTYSPMTERYEPTVTSDIAGALVVVTLIVEVMVAAAAFSP